MSLVPYALLAATLVAAGAPALMATSSDGRWRVVADNTTHRIDVIATATGAVARSMPVADRRDTVSRVARLIDVAPRQSIMALLADIPEAWELLYDPNAEPVFEGLVHDYRSGEAIANPGPLPVRRIHLDEPLTDVLFAPDGAHFIGRARKGHLHVVNLYVRRRIETLAIGGDPRPERGVAWQAEGRAMYAVPDAKLARVALIDGRTWQVALVDVPAPAQRIEIDQALGPVAVVGDRRFALFAAPKAK